MAVTECEEKREGDKYKLGSDHEALLRAGQEIWTLIYNVDGCMHTTGLWGNYILREKKVLCCLQLVCLPMLRLRRSKQEVFAVCLGPPMGCVCRNLVLVTLPAVSTPTDLKLVFSSSDHRYSMVRRKATSIRLEK